MARYPNLSEWLPCTDPNTVGAPGSNGKVVRIVIHTVGVVSDMRHVAASNRQHWVKETKEHPGLKVSAHFTVERDGTVAQHVDTDAAAYGTGWLTTGSIHIEHGGDGRSQELTPPQLRRSAHLISWLAREHTDVPLALTGTSEQNWGDPEKPGITCHRFIQLEFMKRFPKGQITVKACPGQKIIDQLPELLRWAKLWTAPASEE